MFLIDPRLTKAAINGSIRKTQEYLKLLGKKYGKTYKNTDLD
jgi:hypothetical protein